MADKKYGGQAGGYPSDNPPRDTGAHHNSDQKPVKTWTGRGLEGEGFHVTIEGETPLDSEAGPLGREPHYGDQQAILNSVDEVSPGIHLTVGHHTRAENIDSEYLAGWRYEPITKEFTKEWITQNIHGGHLNYHINPHYDDDPPWFTITFIYTKAGIADGGHKHPARPPYGWHFTTPAIPYTGNLGKDIVGSGVSTIWINPGKVPAGNTWTPGSGAKVPNPNTSNVYWENWSEFLVYPLDPVHPGQRFDPNLFNAPNAPDVNEFKANGDPNPHNVFPWWSNEKDWTVQLEFGANGNLGIPNWPELDAEIKNIFNYINQQVDGVYKKNPDGDGTVIYHPPALDGKGRPTGNSSTQEADTIVRGSYGNYSTVAARNTGNVVGDGSETKNTAHPTVAQRELTRYSIDNVDIGNNAQIEHGKLYPMPYQSTGRIVIENGVARPSSGGFDQGVKRPDLKYSYYDIQDLIDKFGSLDASIVNIVKIINQILDALGAGGIALGAQVTMIPGGVTVPEGKVTAVYGNPNQRDFTDGQYDDMRFSAPCPWPLKDFGHPANDNWPNGLPSDTTNTEGYQKTIDTPLRYHDTPPAIIRGTSGYDGMWSHDFGGDWSFALWNPTKSEVTMSYDFIKKEGNSWRQDWYMGDGHDYTVKVPGETCVWQLDALWCQGTESDSTFSSSVKVSSNLYVSLNIDLTI